MRNPLAQFLTRSHELIALVLDPQASSRPLLLGSVFDCTSDYSPEWEYCQLSRTREQGRVVN